MARAAFPLSDGGGVMVFEDNFVKPAVGRGHSLIDPVLKLRLSIGRWEPESRGRGGSISIHLYQDPEIEAGRLTMPMPEPRRRMFEMAGNKGDPGEVVFVSENSRQIATIILDIDEWDGEIALIDYGSSQPTYKKLISLIKKAECGMVSELPWQTLLYMLKSIPEMPYWKSEYANRWNSRRISLYVNRPCALELANFAGLEIPSGEPEFVLVGSREIAE
jgi:hypothetical protein